MALHRVLRESLGRGRTSNIQHRTSKLSRLGLWEVRCSMLDVGCGCSALGALYEGLANAPVARGCTTACIRRDYGRGVEGQDKNVPAGDRRAHLALICWRKERTHFRRRILVAVRLLRLEAVEHLGIGGRDDDGRLASVRSPGAGKIGRLEQQAICRPAQGQLAPGPLVGEQERSGRQGPGQAADGKHRRVLLGASVGLVVKRD